MINQIFPNYFYSLLTPTNKEEILKADKNAKIDKNIKREEVPTHKQSFLFPEELGSFLVPSVQKFFKELGYKDKTEVTLQSIWKNVYEKGQYQNMHDHLCGYDNADLSASLFLEDDHPNASRFYFYNRHQSEISGAWRKMIKSLSNFHVYWIYPKAGDILFFPSHMLHGVTPHNLEKPRETISFNMKIK